ncbi:MAG TPA: hypothetical protein VIH52_03775 [Candidatus Nanoarchaeia archaeon]|nr:hypothetical protein [uncultured archaeon]
MSESFPKTLIVDIGRSWTKAFLVSVDKNNLIIEKRQSLPTSTGDTPLSYSELVKSLKAGSETKVILTGSLAEAEDLAKSLSVVFVSEEAAKKALGSYLDNHGFKKPVVLDAGDYSYSANTKVGSLGAFLTTEVSEVDIENYFGNKSLHPRAVPISQAELEFEEAFLRLSFASNREFLNARGVVNTVITGSFISLAPNKAKLGLIIADILFAGRVAQVKVDTKLFAHSFGALVAHNPKFGDLETDFLQDLGAFISFGGKGRVMLDWGYTENQELSIVENEIALVPTSAHQEVKVTFLDSKNKEKITLSGGVFGIMLDGRLKPLRLAFGRAESREAVKGWATAIAKLGVIE